MAYSQDTTPDFDMALNASSPVHSMGSPDNSNFGWVEDEQGYETHQIGQRLSQGHEQIQQQQPMTYDQNAVMQHAFHPTDHSFSPRSSGIDEPSSQWSGPHSPQWNQQWSQFSEGVPRYPGDYHMQTAVPTTVSGRQSIPLTLRTESLAPPADCRSPTRYGESPSGMYPPSSSTVVDDTHAFFTKSQSPLSPTPMVYSFNPVAVIPATTYQEQLRRWRAMQIDSCVVPQKMYRPQAANDKKRYIDDIQFDLPIVFRLATASEDGVSVHEALNGHLGNLLSKDQEVFVNCGPSVSIRINWPGYDGWSKQIPTKNWKSVPGPITLQKLAKQVARRIDDFIKAVEDKVMDDDEDSQPKWRVGGNGIQLHDLVLVSLHHVSKGSWQPQIRVIPRPGLQLQHS